MYGTENFNLYTDPKLECTCGHRNCDKRVVLLSVLVKVQRVRDDAGRPLSVTSGGRCTNHPDEIHRTIPADHQNCVAVDIAINSGTERMEVVRLGLKHGATAIGVAKTFIHLGWRDTGHQVMWTY